MKTIVYLNHIGHAGGNYELFKSINRIVDETIHDVSIAPIDITKTVIDIRCAINNVSEISNFNNGVIVTDTIENAKEILSCKNNSLKVLYLYDIDWYVSLHDYEDMYDILTNNNLLIFTRSEYHSDVVESLCGRKTNGILKEFDLEKLWNLLEDIKK